MLKVVFIFIPAVTMCSSPAALKRQSQEGPFMLRVDFWKFGSVLCFLALLHNIFISFLLTCCKVFSHHLQRLNLCR